MKRKIVYAFTAVLLTAGITTSQGQNWLTTGNSGTTSSNFIGTIDKVGLKFKTNNVVRMSIGNTGLVGIGTTAPAAKVDIYGGTGTTFDTLHAVHVIVKKTGNYDVIGVDAESQPAAGYGIGVQGLGNAFGVVGYGNIGVFGGGVNYADTTSATGSESDGVDGIGGKANFSLGVYAQGAAGQFNTGIYAVCGPTGTPSDSDNTHHRWAGQFIGDIIYSRAYRFSDAKLKSNIQPVTSAIEKLGKLQTSTYVFRNSEYPQLDLPVGNQLGFIAENMEKTFPELVTTVVTPRIKAEKGKIGRESLTFKSVDYDGIIPVTVAAINEQQKLIQNQSAVIAEQNDRIAKLENQIAQIQNALASQKVSIGEQTGYLLQNTPNPSNGLTTVKFFLPENSKGVLQLTDASGKIVKSYKVSGTGMSQVEINTAAFAVGSYTYSLLIDGKVSDSKNMVITK